jgi:RecB family endonuclease NucS
MKISKNIIRNNGYWLSTFDFAFYCIILKAFESNKNLTFRLNVRAVKRLLNVNDNRTIKVAIENLMNNGILKKKDVVLSRNGDIDLEFCIIGDIHYYDIPEEKLGLIQELTIYAFRIHLLYESYKDDVLYRVPNTTEVAKILTMSRDNIIASRRLLKEKSLLLDTGKELDMESLTVKDDEQIEPLSVRFLEKHLEKLIIKSIHLVEDGMRVLESQYEVREGIIDILAKDKFGKKVIIELKIVDDCKDLIFQCAYYPTQFNEDVRVISICPDYTYKINMALRKLGYVEMKKYEIVENEIKIFNCD